MSSIGSATSYAASLSSQRMHRPDPSKMVDKLFSQLDTKSQGYLEKSDLQSAFAQISSTSGSSSSSSSASVDDVFKQLDGDGDGKVTKDELSDSLKKLADQLDSQFDQMRMNGGGMQKSGGMPPPPPPGGGQDDGLSKDQLSTMASETASSNSTLSSKLSSLANNFDKADTDSDGKVSFMEAMAYEQKTKASAAASTSSDTDSSSSSSSSSSNSQAVLKRIMELMQAYGSNDENKTSLSISA